MAFPSPPLLFLGGEGKERKKERGTQGKGKKLNDSIINFESMDGDAHREPSVHMFAAARGMFGFGSRVFFCRRTNNLEFTHCPMICAISCWCLWKSGGTRRHVFSVHYVWQYHSIYMRALRALYILWQYVTALCK